MSAKSAAVAAPAIDYESRLKKEKKLLVRRYQQLHLQLAGDTVDIATFLEHCRTLFSDFIQHLNDAYPEHLVRRLFRGAYPLHDTFEELQRSIVQLQAELKAFTIDQLEFEVKVVQQCSTFLQVLQSKEQA